MTSDLATAPVESPADEPSREGPAPTLTVRRHRRGYWLVIEADGEVDIAGVPRLRSLLRSDSSHVIFDLRLVTFIDASGLGFLAETHQRLTAADGAVRLSDPSQQTRKLLTLTGLDQHMDVFETVDHAVAGHRFP